MCDAHSINCSSQTLCARYQFLQREQAAAGAARVVLRRQRDEHHAGDPDGTGHGEQQPPERVGGLQPRAPAEERGEHEHEREEPGRARVQHCDAALEHVFSRFYTQTHALSGVLYAQYREL